MSAQLSTGRPARFDSEDPLEASVEEDIDLGAEELSRRLMW
jgi:hypothetical protein